MKAKNPAQGFTQLKESHFNMKLSLRTAKKLLTSLISLRWTGTAIAAARTLTPGVFPTSGSRKKNTMENLIEFHTGRYTGSMCSQRLEQQELVKFLTLGQIQLAHAAATLKLHQSIAKIERLKELQICRQKQKIAIDNAKRMAQFKGKNHRVVLD